MIRREILPRLQLRLHILLRHLDIFLQGFSAIDRDLSIGRCGRRLRFSGRLLLDASLTLVRP